VGEGLANVGRAYIYSRDANSQWSIAQQLDYPGDLDIPDYGFNYGYMYWGSAVGMSGDGNTVALGTYYGDESLGTIDVYVRDGSAWTLQQTIGNTSGGNKMTYNGMTLSSDGNTLVTTSGFNQPGNVLVFARENGAWTMQEQLTKPDGAAYAWGRSTHLSEDGTRLVVGSTHDTVGGSEEAGAAWVYVRDGAIWSLHSTVANPSPSHKGQFGNTVMLSKEGSIVPVSKRTADYDNLKNAGVVSVFQTDDTDTYVFQKELHNADPQKNEYFGGGLALSANGGTAIVTAQSDTSAEGFGSLTVFNTQCNL
jgi:hypothetical protein